MINNLIITLCLLSFGCRPTPPNIKLIDNTTFNESETQQLISFLTAFDKEVAMIENTNPNNIEEAYSSFFKRIKKNSHEGNIKMGIKESDQLKLESNIGADLSAEVWYDSFTFDYNLKDTPYISGKLNVYGKLFRYMEGEIPLSDTVFNESIKRINIAGDLTPSVFADILYNYEKFNIQNEGIRLIIALHYCTHNRAYLNRKEYENSIG